MRETYGRELHLPGYLDQLGEGGRLETGSSDQSTVDGRKAGDGAEVGRLDAAAVQDRDGTANCRSKKLLDVFADEAVYLLHLLVGGIHPRSNSPYRFIGNNELGGVGELYINQGGIQLPEHDLFDLARIPLFQCLPDA